MKGPRRKQKFPTSSNPSSVVVFVLVFVASASASDVGLLPQTEFIADRAIRKVTAASRSAKFSSRVVDNQSSDEEFALLAMVGTLMDIVGGGLAVSSVFRQAAENSTWSAEKADRITHVVSQLKSAWAKAEALADEWAEMQAARQSDAAAAKSKMNADELREAIQPIIAFGLVVGALATLRSRDSFDLFSAEVHSRGEVVVVFALASQLSMTLASGWRMHLLNQNPFALYCAQLVMCFLATTSAMPIVIGCSRSSPRWLVAASLAFTIMFLLLWLTDLDSIANIFRRTGDVCFTSVVVSVLIMVLVGFSARRFLYVFFPGVCLNTVPFYERHAVECASYAAERVAPERGRPVPDLPTRVPAALMAAVLIVACLLCAGFLSVVQWSFVNSSLLREWVIAFVLPLQPFFRRMGYPLPLKDVDFAFQRSQYSFLFGLFVAAIYEVWLLRSVVLGYRRTFAAMVKGKAFQGGTIIKMYGPGGFHAKWSTYFVGALLGNCVLSAFTVCLLFFTMTLAMSLEQFWRLVLSGWRYYVLYALLYVTRTCFFTWVIPAYVVNDDGAVLRRRVWALLYPTLMLLNFIVGATSGVLRSFVMFPFLLLTFFRVDTTFLPDGFEDWDWSFQPFLSLVLHAHARLNPLMCAAVACLASSRCSNESEDCADATPTGQAEDADVQIVTSFGNVAGRMKARNRWRLAVFLVQNPSLSAFRRPTMRPMHPLVGDLTARADCPQPPDRPRPPERMARLVRATTDGELRGTIA